MIRMLRGRVLTTTETYAVIDVAGIGYKVFFAHPDECPQNEEILVHTYLAVRENALDLFGFRTEEELEIFEHLIDLPGIGPKSALHILTQADARLIKDAASKNDAAYLSKLSGIGKKSAEKIIAGLKDIVENDVSALGGTQEDADVIDVLLSLGYSQSDARFALQSISKDATNTQERLREALKLLGK